MDTAELDRICAALTMVISDARRISQFEGINPELRTVTLHAREMHSIPVEALAWEPKYDAWDDQTTSHCTWLKDC